MSTPLIILAAILVIFALVLIPFMMVKRDKQQGQHSKQGDKPARKKKKEK